MVLAGLNEDWVGALIIPDLRACGQLLGLAETPSYASLARNSEVLSLVREKLRVHAKANPASTRCVCRAALLASAPSLDHGEITDKGSINQRAVRTSRPDLVEALYADFPAAEIFDLPRKEAP